MTKLVVFDLDGTLAKPGQPMPLSELERLHRLEESGTKIALSSGKPTFYLCGFARQLGLCDPLLVGENGGVLQVGVELPPPRFVKAPLPQITANALKALREKMEDRFGDRIWYQPNETALTPFPAYQEDFPPLRKLIADFITPEMNLTVYEHPDCFDIVYSALSKATGVRLIAETTGISPEDMIAVGDWTNDYPMFEAVGHSVGINLPQPERASVNVPSLRAALEYILERVSEQ